MFLNHGQKLQVNILHARFVGSTRFSNFYPESFLFWHILVYSSLFVCHSASFQCHSSSFRDIPVPFLFIPSHSGVILLHSGIFRYILFHSVPVFSNAPSLLPKMVLLTKGENSSLPVSVHGSKHHMLIKAPY